MRLHHKLHKIHSKEKPDFFAAEGKKFLFLADCSSQLQGCVTFTFFTLGYDRKRTQKIFLKVNHSWKVLKGCHTPFLRKTLLQKMTCEKNVFW